MRTMVKHITLPDEAERDTFNENHDCTVVGLAGAADIPYREAHDILAQAGRKRRHGFKFRAWLNRKCWDARIAGEPVCFGKYEVQRVKLPEYTHTVTLARFLKDFPRGRFLLRKRGHVLAVIDGQVLNIGWSGVRMRLTDIWYLKERTTNVQNA